MNTDFYLLLPWSESRSDICLIKLCKAQNKDMAALHFQEILNTINTKLPYEKEDIIQYVKADHELTEDDRKEIKDQGIIPDIHFSEADSAL